ncbi:MAG: T9SS type A sorting domain-containing protein [Candidatus Limimorpha sp.]
MEELCELKANDSHYLNVFPNPFKNYAVIEYSLPDGFNIATLSLVDVSGQNILYWTIDKNKGRIHIKETLNHGTYVCYLNCDGNIVDAIILRKTKE